MPLNEEIVLPTDAGKSTNPQVLPKGVPTPSNRWLKRFFVALIGGTVLLIGFAMIFLPGPALIVIPAGLAILATEFLWARRALRSCQMIAVKTKRRARHWWPFNRKTKKAKLSSKKKSESAPTQIACHRETR